MKRLEGTAINGLLIIKEVPLSPHLETLITCPLRNLHSWQRMS